MKADILLGLLLVRLGQNVKKLLLGNKLIIYYLLPICLSNIVLSVIVTTGL